MKRRIIVIACGVVLLLLIGLSEEHRYTSKFPAILEDFREEVVMAMSTPRIGVSTNIRVLRSIEDDMGRLAVPVWRSGDSKEYALLYMEHTIKALTAFRANNDLQVELSFLAADIAYQSID